MIAIDCKKDYRPGTFIFYLQNLARIANNKEIASAVIVKLTKFHCYEISASNNTENSNNINSNCSDIFTTVMARCIVVCVKITSVNKLHFVYF